MIYFMTCIQKKGYTQEKFHINTAKQHIWKQIDFRAVQLTGLILFIKTKTYLKTMDVIQILKENFL